jgi:hypothetical protein
MKRIGWIALVLTVAGCGAEPQSNRTAGPVHEAAAPQPSATANANLPADTGRASRFTPLSEAACRITSESEETGDWVRRCPGIAPYGVEWSSGDLREDLALVGDDGSVDLGLPVIVAKGAFDALGKQIEWRGPAGGAPDVLVVRVHVADQTGKTDSGRLAIVTLGPKPCVAAIVGVKPGQSAEARAIADRAPLPSCLKAD